MDLRPSEVTLRWAVGKGRRARAEGLARVDRQHKRVRKAGRMHGLSFRRVHSITILCLFQGHFGSHRR